MTDTPPAPSGDQPGLETQRLQAALEHKMFGTEVPIEVGRFVIEDRLGEGGMGTVFRARDPDLDRTVALKVLRRSDFGSGPMEEEQARLRREALALAKLSHPNVVVVHEVGVHDQEVFIAMEYVEGGTLASWCAGHPEPTAATVGQLLDFALGAARGLAAAHAAGLLHRDLKPANLLVGKDDRLRIADFGLVRYRTEDPPTVERGDSADEADKGAQRSGIEATPLTQTGQVVGTPAYMAPEQFEGVSDVRSDQFSWAVSFFEALYGMRPYPGTTPSEVVASMYEGRMAEPEGREVPAPVRRLLNRALDADPGERFESMQDIVAELERIRRPRRWLLVSSAFGLGGALVLGGVWLNEDPPDPLPAQCQDARPLLDEAWGDASRDAIGRRIANSGVPFATQTGKMVEHRLDAYAQSWVEAYQATCVESHRAPQDESPRLKLACLDQAATEMSLITATLAEADDQVVGSSADLLLLLPEPDECADADRLRFASSSVSYADPAVREVVGALSQAEVYERVGRRDDAIAAATSADQRARSLEVPALRARAGRLLSAYTYGTGDYAKAAEHAQQALAMAERSGEPSSLALVWLRLFFARSAQAEPKLADAALERAASWASHPECRPAAAASVLRARANQKSTQGKHQERLRLLEEALELAQRAFDPSHPRVAQIIGDQAEAFAENGDTALAEAAFERAIDLIEAFYGEAHVNLVPILQARASALTLMGEDQRSVEAAQRGLEILANNPWYRPIIRVQLLLQLAEVFRKRRELEDAIQYAQQAERVALEQLGPGSKAALHAKLTFANISYSFQKFEVAAKAYQELLAAPALPQIGRATITIIRSNCSLALSFVARHEEAIAMAEQALADAAEHFGTPSDRMVNFTSSMGQVYGAAGRHGDAAGQFRDALRMLDELERQEDPRRGKVYWGLAEQLDALGKREEAVQWGQRALAAMVAGGFESGAQDLRKWLEERGAAPS